MQSLVQYDGRAWLAHPPTHPPVHTHSPIHPTHPSTPPEPTPTHARTHAREGMKLLTTRRLVQGGGSSISLPGHVRAKHLLPHSTCKVHCRSVYACCCSRPHRPHSPLCNFHTTHRNKTPPHSHLPPIHSHRPCALRCVGIPRTTAGSCEYAYGVWRGTMRALIRHSKYE